MEANIRETKLNDITHLGIRLTVGVIFLVHGIGKAANPGFGGFLSSLGLPAEMAPLIALAEIVPGILLIIGVLSRIASSLLSIIMIGAILHVKKAQTLTGGQGAYEFELILLAANLAIITMGPGRVSIAHIAKKIPRFLH